MLQQFVRDILTFLRRPTLATLQTLERADWRSALYCFALSVFVSSAIQSSAAIINGAVLAQQQQQVQAQLGNNPLVGLYALLQSPWSVFAIGMIGGSFSMMLWIGLPYGIGRLMGGKPSFGPFFATFALFAVPIIVVSSCLSLFLSGTLSLVFVVVSLGFDAFLLYCIYLNLRTTMALSTARALVAVATPLLLFLFACIVFFIITVVIAVRNVTR